MRVLLTRPEPDSTALAERLKTDGIDSVIAPLLEIVPRDPGPSPVPMDSVQALLVTSANAAERLASVTERRDVRVLCVGEATADAVRAQGFAAVESADGAIEELTALALGTLDAKAGPVLHLSGEAVAGDLAGMLRLAGFEAHRLVVYEARPVEALGPRAVAELRRGRLDAVLFFSPRTAETFVSLVNAADLAGKLSGVAAIAISDKAADACRSLPWRSVLVAASPDLPGMVAALTQLETALAKPVDGSMSEQDKNQQDKAAPKPAKEEAAKTAETKPSAASAAGAKADPIKPEIKQPAAPRRSRAKLYGYGVLALVVLAIIAVGTLPLWRPAVQPYLSQIGITLPDLTPASAEDQRLAALSERVTALEAAPRQAGAAPQELADLRAALEARITGLEERQTALSEEIQLVREMLAGEGTASSATASAAPPVASPTQPAQPSPEIVARLEKLEAEARALSEAQAALNIGALRDSVAALESRLDDLPRADPQELSRLHEDIGALRQSLAAVEAGAGQREALVLAAAQLAGPLQQGLPYEIELAALRRTAGSDPLVAELAAQLQPRAAQGVPTLEALRQRFPDVAGAAVRAARVGESDSVVGQTLNRIAGLVSLRRVGQVEGEDAEARIARAEAAAAQGDLAAAVAELDGLPADAAAVVAEWRADAEARLAAERALARLRDHLLAGLSQPAAKP